MKKVLLVEDNSSLALALSIRLKSTGYKLINADTVSGALSEVVRRKPDVTLIDINLPDGDGFALAQQIQSNPNCINSPIIFITASKSSGYREKATQYGAIAYLEKPFTAGQLIDAIERSHYSTHQYGGRISRQLTCYDKAS